MQAVIECGANNGIDSENLLQYLDVYPDCQLFLFEPTRELLNKFLYPKFDKINRVNILPFAIDIENSFKEFYVAGWDEKGCKDWGCSSLHNFADNIHEKWPGRPDFEVSHSYKVPTIKLKTVCEMYNITDIIYLWVDTQGNDFNVLKSLEDKIDILWEGKVEVADKVELYKGVNNKLNDTKKWLEENNFQTYVHSYGNEADIFFLNKKLLATVYTDTFNIKPDIHYTFF